ncbi:hypothetical protein ID866_6931 [Astraeus odoratus]|nr:hypothetical protein ID866_6931 [Astraeus odoratus]
MQSGSRVWFVTGSSSGFGLEVTKLVLEKGERVVATLRKPEVLADLALKYPDTLLVLRLDVTEPEEVKAAFSAARERFGRIDVVLSNAGVGIVSEIEGTSEKKARDIFEVNFWGASYVCREAVRFFREENQPRGGRLVQVTSVSGIESCPGSAWYCASKFAIEAFAEALASEVSPSWNIKVTITEPGPFLTNCPIMNMVQEPIHPAYDDPTLPSMQFREMVSNAEASFNGDPYKFAEAMYRLVHLEDPPLRLPLHQITLGAFERKGRHLLDTVDKWASWSDDIYRK